VSMRILLKSVKDSDLISLSATPDYRKLFKETGVY
jgi:hypothetical protein